VTAPTFSVIIAVRDGADTIARAIESVQAQTEPPLEVIVVDDGSADDTAAVVRGYDVTLVQQPNGGLSNARNRGVAASSGDFIVLLDADDELRPRKLEATRRKLEDDPGLDIVTSDATIRYRDRTARWYADITWVDEPHQRLGILRGNFIFVSAAVRRTALDAVGGFDESYAFHGEGETWVRMILAGARAGCVMEELVVYDRTNPHSLSSAPLPKLLRDVELFGRLVDGGQLEPDELEVARRRLEWLRSKARAVEARVAVSAGAREARRLSWGVFVDRRQPAVRRLKAGVAAVWPGLAQRRADRPWA
jgi:glycosyltransferase involved in cell wall biosynthesis